MQMICLRNVPFVDTNSLGAAEGREALFRDDHGFVLYLSTDLSIPSGEERIVRLGAREALIWLNEAPQEQGSFWI